jgi:uncharacterized repeat protein (TIGR01451 family)
MSVFNVIQATYDYSFSMTLKNSGSVTYSGLTAEVGRLTGFENTEFIPGSETIGPKESKTYFFKADIRKDLSPGIYYLPIRFYYDNNGAKELLVAGNAVFSVTRYISSVAGYDAAILDMAYTLENNEGFTAGEINNLTISVINRGNVLIQDVKVSLTLPEGMILNNSMAAQSVGSLGVGIDKTVKFPILIDKKIENKNYAITVNMTGSSKSGSANSNQTIYIPVTGGEEKKEEEDKDIPINMEITDIEAPAGIIAGDDVTLFFSIKNIGDHEVENIKVEAVPETGLSNKSRNIFVETKMAPLEVKSYAVSYLSDKKIDTKSVPIRITLTAGNKDSTLTLNQYASVFIEKPDDEEDETKGVKTPQLIVDDYSYGGNSVRAGASFTLNISFRNTSSKNMANAKISFNAEGGAFIPIGSSNSLYISDIGAGNSISRSIEMSVNPSAEQRTTAINVAMVYEDNEGGQFNATDVISIPVVQTTKLTIDDIIGPPGLNVGMQSGLDVRFYNTGNTTLQNLRVKAEGNFDLMDDSVYYAGNMNSGVSDSYSFTFVPIEEGELKGTVVFTYDDPSGNPMREEKEFSFIVMPPFDNPYMDMPFEISEQPNNTKYYIAGGLLLVVIIGSIILLSVLKRRKMRKEVEFDL